MKKNLVILLLIIISANLYSQIIQKSDYTYTFYTTINTHILEEYDCDLNFDINGSLFTWNKIGSTDLQTNNSGNYTRAEHLKNDDFNYFNKKLDTIISKNHISNKEFHFIKQKKPILVWKIFDIIKQIDKFECKKATTDYKGRIYTAWFTTKIPVNYGPWKLNGLPGLIIKAYDTKKEITFALKEIKQNKSNIEINSVKKYISLADFYQRKVDYPFEQLKTLQSRASKGSTITISGIKYNFIEKDYENLGKKEFKK